MYRVVLQTKIGNWHCCTRQVYTLQFCLTFVGLLYFERSCTHSDLWGQVKSKSSVFQLKPSTKQLMCHTIYNYNIIKYWIRKGPIVLNGFKNSGNIRKRKTISTLLILVNQTMLLKSDWICAFTLFNWMCFIHTYPVHTLLVCVKCPYFNSA